jgi:hypothetical protein
MLELEKERFYSKLEKQHKQNCRINNAIAVWIFWNNEVRETCQDKINSWEDVLKFINFRNMLSDNITHDRLTELQIERARNITIEKLLDHLWIEYWKRSCACPIHNWDSKDSFSFKDSVYHCFVCLASGDVISLIWILHKINFVQSIKYLLKL